MRRRPISARISNASRAFAPIWIAPRADADLARALALDPGFGPALVNRADLLRALGREAEAAAGLREAIARRPDDAVLQHTLGLSLIRQGQREEGLRALGEAVRLAPDDPRFAYVYGVGLHDLGRAQEGVRVLETALLRHPNDVDALFALASYLREAGNPARAFPYARRLVELLPQDPQARALLSQLEASPAR